ncbi:MAG: glycosyltransferase family 39 protein [Gammaproteobacteria bacterium]|nr:glycosyltransferase family 39 protein [Gammaproteobacteria bacterium]
MSRVISTRTGLFICLITFAVIWFGGLGYRPLFATDEGRYAEIPREMMAAGDWVTPRLNGLRYFEKPPLQYWMTAASYAVFGVHDWVARLWTAVAGFLTVLLAGFTAFRLYGRKAGWMTAAVLGGSFYFVFLSHFSTLDAVLCGAMSLNLFGFLLAQRATRGSRAELGWMLASWAGAALAVLDKGLIGILLPGAVIALYMILKRDTGLLRRLRILPGLTLFLAMVLPWFIAVSIQNPDFPWQFFMVQQFLRFLTPAQHRPGPGWYFIPLLVLSVLPWLAAAGRGLLSPLRGLLRREAFNPEVLIWLWIVVIFAFFSVSHSKLPSYILPIIPAFAVLIGQRLSRLERLPWSAGAISLATGIVLLALAVMAPEWGLGRSIDARLPHSFLVSAIVAASLLVVATVMAVIARRRALPAVVLIAAAWLIATRLIMLGGAALGPQHSTSALAAQVARYKQPNVPVYSVAGYQQTLPFYLRRTVTLVKYQGEMAFGIARAGHSLEDRYLPTLEDFAARWRREPEALAFVPRTQLAKVKTLQIRYRIAAGNSKWVALVHKHQLPLQMFAHAIPCVALMNSQFCVLVSDRRYGFPVMPTTELPEFYFPGEASISRSWAADQATSGCKPSPPVP